MKALRKMLQFLKLPTVNHGIVNQQLHDPKPLDDLLAERAELKADRALGRQMLRLAGAEFMNTLAQGVLDDVGKGKQ